MSGTHNYFVKFFWPDPPLPAQWRYWIDGGSLYSFAAPASTWNNGSVNTNAERHGSNDTWLNYPVFTTLSSFPQGGPWTLWQGWFCFADSDQNYQNDPTYQGGSVVVVSAGNGNCG